MSVTVETYVKKKDFLICVDSDGCAMDTMDIKHIRCFGPRMVEEWGLEANGEAILKRWNDINLYTVTRGINRFKGLAKALREINDAGTPIDGIDILETWVENSPELSNGALESAIALTPAEVLKKALNWSKRVNESIQEIPFADKKPFEGVKEALEMAHEKADIAIVSSANLDAVIEEWELYGLLDHVDIVMSQNVGSKAFCIGEMLKKGYEKGNVMMTGDALGDRDAAYKNGVFYYPILVRHEKESWSEFTSEAVDRLINHQFKGEYQEKKLAEFINNLNVEG